MHSRSDCMIQIVGAITVTKDKTDRCHYTEVLTWLETGGLHQPLKLYNKNESGRNEIPSLPTEVLTEAEDSKKEEAMDGKPNAATGFHHLVNVRREATTFVVDP